MVVRGAKAPAGRKVVMLPEETNERERERKEKEKETRKKRKRKKE